MTFYNKLIKDIFSINIPLKEDTITPLHSSPQSGFADCYYCNQYMDNDIVRDHDHLNGKFRGYARNKCNLQTKNPRSGGNANNFVQIYAFNSNKYDNHLFTTKLAKKI